MYVCLAEVLIYALVMRVIRKGGNRNMGNHRMKEPPWIAESEIPKQPRR